MSNLTDFLLARIAEDEAEAAEWSTPLSDNYTPARAGKIVYRRGDKRAWAECEAKRAIVEEGRALINSFGDWDAEAGAIALWTDVTRRERSQAHGRLHTIAAVYADHPEYRQEWKP